MGKHIIKSPSLMGKLKADTDLLGFFLIDCSVADNDKSCDVLLIMADIFCKEFKPEQLPCFSACNGCAGRIPFFTDFFCRGCCVFRFYCFPSGILFQKTSALGKSLRMRIYCSDILQGASRKPKKNMIHPYHLLSYNMKLVFCKKIINICHNALSGVLNRKNCIIRPS